MKYLLIVLLNISGLCGYGQPKTLNVPNKITSKRFYRNSYPLIDNFNLLNCRFLGGVDFSQSSINDINFSDSNIDTLNFYLTHVHGTANFQNTIFKNKCNFWYSSFYHDANFIGSKFYADANFQFAIFHNADFRAITFASNASFDYSIFENVVNFTSSGFKESSFYNCTFYNVSNFEGVKFQKTNFKFTKFNKTCHLDNLLLNDSTEFNFYKSVLPDTFDFSGNYNLKNIIDLTQSNFFDSTRFDYKKNTLRPVNIFLYNTDISKIKIDYVHFKLYFDSIYISPNKKRALSNYDTEFIYRNLLENFAVNKDQKSYHRLYKEYRSFQIKNRLLRWLFNKKYDYGSNIQVMIIFTGIVWFLFSLINMISYKNTCWYKFLNAKVYVLFVHIPIGTNPFKQFFINLYYSIIYTGIIFFNPIIKLEHLKFKNIGGLLWVLIIYLSGLILLWYILHYLLKSG